MITPEPLPSSPPMVTLTVTTLGNTFCAIEVTEEGRPSTGVSAPSVNTGAAAAADDVVVSSKATVTAAPVPPPISAAPTASATSGPQRRRGGEPAGGVPGGIQVGSTGAAAPP